MLTKTYDVIVIGLGAMGSAAVYQLAKRGVRVLGLDQFDPPHHLGSSHGETRVTRLATAEGAVYIPLARRSHEIWRELERECGEELLKFCGGYIICPREGYTEFHGAADVVTKTAELAEQFNIDYRLEEASEIRRRFPMLKVGKHEHGVYETTGGIVFPERAVTVQLSQAVRFGADLHTHEKVLAYRDDSTSVTVKTVAGRYSAHKVILTAGPWMGDFWPPYLREITRVFRQVFYWFDVEDPSAFSSERFPWILWLGGTVTDFCAFFPVLSGTTAAVKVVTEQYQETSHPTTVERTVHPREIEHMYEYYVKNRVEGITARCLQTSVCLYTVTSDEHFLIDWHPASERVLLASPCSGHGFKHSAAIGEALAQMVTEGGSDLDLKSFCLDRPVTTDSRSPQNKKPGRSDRAFP